MRVVTDAAAAPGRNGPRSVGPSAVAVGVFDGLHRGHQAVVGSLLEEARRRELVPTVATFDPHPTEVVDPARAPRRLGTLAQRFEGLERLGVEQVRLLSFTPAMAAESAEEFIERTLIGELDARLVVVGEDFRFGRGRRGDVAMLRELGAGRFEVLATVLVGAGERYSSSAVRGHLAAGDVAAATELLGRPFVVRGTVVAGDRRGRELGFPTANLHFPARQAIPADGVYAAAAHFEEGWVAAAASVGRRPQFYEDGELLVEAHLLDFTGDLYGRTLEVAFLARLRAQERFDSLEALIAQMDRDVEATRTAFQGFAPEGSVLLG